VYLNTDPECASLLLAPTAALCAPSAVLQHGRRRRNRQSFIG